MGARRNDPRFGRIIAPMSALPVLYSFRRCPYAIRTRMTLAYAGTRVELREILLRDKPAEMLAASAKGTVPVLVLPDGRVIDESIDIMRWALCTADPDGWNPAAQAKEVMQWVALNDGPFKSWLDKYKYADRFPEQSASWYRNQAEPFIGSINTALEQHRFLMGPTMGLADVALFPFLRQFAMVDRSWFDQSPYDPLRQWLASFMENPLFKRVMLKRAPWVRGQVPVALLESDSP
ncbi:MAG: glutathione S-transferase [Halieaceae bacterium]|jgi:glutathione S-transferase